MPVSPARAAAFDILLKVATQDAYASELLHSDRLAKLSPADRGLTTEIVMGVLRWQSRLDSAIASNSSRPIAKLDVEVVVALRIAAYQLLYLNRIPPHAAINESVELVKRARKSSAAPFANAVLRKLDGAPLAPAEAAATPTELAAQFAHPAWLVERWASQYGFEWTEAICRYDQRVPVTSIRIDRPEVASELEAEGISLAPGSLLASARTVTSGDVTQTRAFREGRVFIQDEASQLVALLVGHGSRILDCCAAPGSKTAAIADRNSDAKITAVELHPHRAQLLRKRVPASNVEVVTGDITQLKFSESFDRILADVPCSGTGTLARNPEIKWRLKHDDLTDLHQRQVAILRAALQHLAPSGRLVYSTCSLEEGENEAVVTEVLADHPNIRVLDCHKELEALKDSAALTMSDLDGLLSGPCLRTIPGIHPCDGFFTAIVERKVA
jgi:16S rRNA (cytosine967-C5)-methyltransferase